MKTVEFFNVYYFMYILIAAAIFFALLFGLRKANKKVIFWVLFGILAFNFCLHFLKLAFLPYRDGLPSTIRKVTFENICAVSTLIFPFLYLSKKNTARDYMFYLGTISGILACFVPTEALGKSPFIFDTIRFYICHIILWIVPLAMVILGEHKLDYHRIWRAPTIFLCVECVILVNEVILMSIGFVEGTLETLLSAQYRNNSFVFGITPDFEAIAGFLLIFVPKFLRVHPLTGEAMYWPILWMVIPIYIYFSIIFFLMSLFWEHKHVKNDIIELKEKFKRSFLK